MTDYRLDPDGPHSDDYTRHVASAFAESVRVLNYVTRTSAGVPHPATLNSVLGELRTGIQRMYQLLRQLDRHLVRFDCDELADSIAGSPSLTLGTARVDLNEALTDATNLADYLDKAFNDTSGLYLRDQDGE
jgi:hypothetical protein